MTRERPWPCRQVRPECTRGSICWCACRVRPVVSIASIRGRARGSGSEFVLACDLRLASRENTLLGQFEVGSGVVPGGGPMARLARLVGRGRALEILLVADDCDGPRAEQYGYVNRVIADDQLDDEVDQIASRLASFDRDAIARTKSYVDQVTLPPDSEFPPALADFFEMLGRPPQQAQYARLEALGLGVDSDFERRLGERVVEALADPELGGHQFGVGAGQCVRELPTGMDPKLGEHLAQVPLHGAWTEKEPRADLGVRQPVAGQLGYLPLLCGQIVAGLGPALAHLSRRWPAARELRARRMPPCRST